MKHLTSIPAPPARPASGHKGTFGTVIVIGGSPTMIGAPALCARSAFRGGAGLVKIAAAAELLPHILSIEPSATGIELQKTTPDPFSEKGSGVVFAVGPGWGTEAAKGAILAALLRTNRPVVLDADGLNLLARQLNADTGQLRDAELILTPHPGEYRRLAEPLGIELDPADPDQRVDAAAALAERLGAVVVLKGQHTVVSDATRYAINQTGNPALATAGSGDVLTGLIAALIAQGMTGFDAAVLGANLHGLAADQWAQAHGRSGMLAHDLADQLPKAFEATRESNPG